MPPKISIHFSLFSSRIWTFNMKKELDIHAGSSRLCYRSYGRWLLSSHVNTIRAKKNPMQYVPLCRSVKRHTKMKQVTGTTAFANEGVNFKWRVSKLKQRLELTMHMSKLSITTNNLLFKNKHVIFWSKGPQDGRNWKTKI